MRFLLPAIAVMSAHLAAAELAPPFDHQVAEKTQQLIAHQEHLRVRAGEALGFMRAYASADALALALADSSVRVRREAAMSLAWCGSRQHLPSLLKSLSDPDWTVSQAASVALENLTGIEFPFDALANKAVRESQVKHWIEWCAALLEGAMPQELSSMIQGPDKEAQLRGIRAMGSLGGAGASAAIIKRITPFRSVDYGKVESLDKELVIAGLRSLGRLREPEGLPVLIDFLNTIGWARYAADALGEFGSVKAVAPLVAHYPRFAKDLNRRLAKDFPADDEARLGWNPEDRMYETPYAIILALSRLPWDDAIDPATRDQFFLLLLANIPSDWDGGMLYEPESFQSITFFLLERAGLRRAACEAAFEATQEKLPRWRSGYYDAPALDQVTFDQGLQYLTRVMFQDVPFMAQWFPALCDPKDVPRLVQLLEHDNGWVRINAAKALMFLRAADACGTISRLLAASHPETDYGFSGVLEHDELDTPGPRWREAFARALGRLGAQNEVPLLVTLLEEPRNALEVQTAAALALDELGTSQALAALRRAEAVHPYHNVRLIARESLWRHNQPAFQRLQQPASSTAPMLPSSYPSIDNAGVVFIKGDNKMRTDFNEQSGQDPWRQTYSIDNSGPTMREGHNLYLLKPARPNGQVTPLTHFTNGYVADCEVSWDGRKILFSRRLNSESRHYTLYNTERATLKDSAQTACGSADDPWWQIYEINPDGSGLRQLTFGPYHHVQPAYLPDGRIVCSTTRIGTRDEYHGYPCLGLAVMNADGSDLHCIGFNVGGDREPAVLNDGRIVFSRLDLFYSRLKTELTIQAVFPDGTHNETLYGPERREFWYEKSRNSGISGWSEAPPRHRVLRLTQPQPFGNGRVICSSPEGFVIVGPGRDQEQLIPHDPSIAPTCPFPLPDGRILCSATRKAFGVDGKVIGVGTAEFKGLAVHLRQAADVDLGLYFMDPSTGKLELLYNDPATAEFDARPLIPRAASPVLPDGVLTRQEPYTAQFFCRSGRISQEERVRSRARFARVVEGVPFVSRHETQQNDNGHLWRNHGGTHARVLGSVPLASDGSFFVEIPADRLIHFQLLDSDREVVGNQLLWMYARPGETRGCVGCHENRSSATMAQGIPQSQRAPPIALLPIGGEFTYRAKAWLKGTLPDETERQLRVVRAVNAIGRY